MTMGALMTHTPARSRRRKPPRPIVDLATHPERWLRVSQCAAHLQVSEAFLWKCIVGGSLIATTFAPRVTRIALDDFRVFVKTKWRST